MNTQQLCASAILINENKEILFTKRSMKEDFLPGFWDVPGGEVEPGEELEECLRRELREECGIEIEIIRIVGLNRYMMHDIERIETTYLCKALSTDINLDHEHTEYKWLKYEDRNEIDISDYMEKLLEPAKPDLN